MEVYNIVFSPTGGTKKAARALAQSLDKDVHEIDVSKADFKGCDLKPGSLAVIAMPSFGGRAPALAIARLQQIQANGTKAIVMAVYGARAQEDTLLEMADTAKACGFEVIAGVEAIAQHSMFAQYASGRPNVKDQQQLQDFGARIQKKAQSDACTDPDLPGNRPYKKAGAGLVPKATDACVSCGLCAKVCPARAIDPANPKKTDKAACITCMRCVSVCSHDARKINGLAAGIAGLVLKKECSIHKENRLYI